MRALVLILSLAACADRSGLAGCFERMPDGRVTYRVGWAPQSIGVRDGSTANMKATPVPLTIGGNPVISLPPHRSEVTDAASLVTHAGDELVVNISFVNPTNKWAGAQRRDRVSYYSVDADSYASAAMLGTVNMQAGPTDGRTHCVDWVQVY